MVVKRGRALVGARALVVEVLDGDELLVAAGAGELPPDLVGQRVKLAQTVAAAALETQETQRLDDPANRLRFEEHGLGFLGFAVRTGLVVPLIYRGQRYGAMLALDHMDTDLPRYSGQEQRVLEAFAASAATALGTARSALLERRRQRVAAAEQERARWARELHDDTLQGLASIRLMLAALLKQGGWDDAARQAESIPRGLVTVMNQADVDIASLRGLITELRPVLLDVVGTRQAITTLADRAANLGVTVEVDIDLAYEQGRHPQRHTDELETTIYRIVQEALTNARKHGNASHVHVTITEDDTTVTIHVTDNGTGFDPTTTVSTGFGLLGMQERTDMLGGHLTIESAPTNGTRLHVTLPATHRS